MRKRSARQLGEKQREKFVELFYLEIGVHDLDETFEENDRASGTPWSCPWSHGSRVILLGDTIEECVKDYCDGYRDEVRGYIEEDIKRSEEEDQEDEEDEEIVN